MTSQLEHIADLRGWLALIDDVGELRHIDGAHWDEEIGAASQVNYLRPSPSALMFDNITGYRSGQRVLSRQHRQCSPTRRDTATRNRSRRPRAD